MKAELVSTLSEVYMGLGSFRRADDLIRRSLSLNVGNRETRARQYAFSELHMPCKVNMSRRRRSSIESSRTLDRRTSSTTHRSIRACSSAARNPGGAGTL